MTYISMDITTVQGNSDKIKAITELSSKLATTAYFVQDVLFNPTIVCDRDNDPACADTKVISCANEDEKVIYIADAQFTGIVYTENCIVLSAKKGDYVRTVDRMLYSWFGIMD